MASVYNEAMTVILAGVFENGKGAILVSDKGRTIVFDNGNALTSDRDDVSKIKKLNPYIYVLAAGARHITVPYIKDLEEVIKNDTRVSEVIDKAAKIYKSYRDSDVANNVLLHYNYKTLDEFRAADDISQTLAAVIDINIRRHRTDFDFIIVGLENDVFTIYGLVDPGYFIPIHDGYVVGGSAEGKLGATRILHDNFFLNMNKEEARKLLIEAKNEARQCDKSVGAKTDIRELISN